MQDPKFLIGCAVIAALAVALFLDLLDPAE